MISVLMFSHGANFANRFFVVSHVCVDSISSCCETVCNVGNLLTVFLSVWLPTFTEYSFYVSN